MKNFRRSLRYLWPYRMRLGISFVCVFFIAVLWSGGLGMLLPGMKILISEEGLHGWAWSSLTGDKLDARVVLRMVPAQIRIDTSEGEKPTSLVVDVVSLQVDGRADRAGLKGNDWIVGLLDGDKEHELIRADALAQILSEAPDGEIVTLRVYDQFTDQVRAVPIELNKAGLSAKLLGKMARSIPQPKDYPDRFNLLLWGLIIAVVITVLRDGFRFCQEYLVSSAVLSAAMDIRSKNYNVALRLPTTFFAQKGTSDTVSRFVPDITTLANGQSTLFGKTMVEPAKAIGSLAMALILSWKLTLVVLIGGPPAYFLVSQFGKLMKRASRRALESLSDMLAVLNETLAGIRVVKAYTMEATERKRFHRVHRQLLKQQRRMARIDAATAPSVEALGIVGGTIAVGMAGWLVLNGHMDPELFMAWMACLVAVFDPVRKLAKVPNRFQKAEAAAARIFELQDQPQEQRVPGAPQLHRHKDTIEFRDTCFRYPATEIDAVKNVNLTIQHGEVIAIVGPNGSGKTTLVSLLPRLLDPTGGAVFIDGQDLMTVSLRALRRQIGLVTQDTVLFAATIRENISYGLRRASDEAVLSAAKHAFVDEFVQQMPNGYDTMVGEHGATLSGGQKQRIAIARAILRDPAILIFDEATSQIDADSEHRIHQAMDEFTKGRTSLIIAHRFATVMSADRIVVMEDGGITDVGTHDELIKRCRLYAHLYNTQFSDTGG